MELSFSIDFIVTVVVVIVVVPNNKKIPFHQLYLVDVDVALISTAILHIFSTSGIIIVDAYTQRLYREDIQHSNVSASTFLRVVTLIIFSTSTPVCVCVPVVFKTF